MRVRKGASLIGATAWAMPSAPASRAVISESDSPLRNRWLRAMCMARSRSPSMNQPSSPSAFNCASACQLSSATPQPRTVSFSPAMA